MEKHGKYRGWKNGKTNGVDLGNNKRNAIKEAKRIGLNCVLLIRNGKGENEWVWEA